jgi:hypothetical protein
MSRIFNVRRIPGFAFSPSADRQAFESERPSKRAKLSGSGICVLTANAILLVAGPSAWTQPTHAGEIEADLKVQVLVYNYAPVSSQTLAESQQLARHIFRKGGVEVVWVANTLLDEGSYTLEQIDLILRVLPQARATLPSRTALGEALPCQSSREGCIANVFYSRVWDCAERGNSPLKQVLGHALAHELGHLLLGSNSHSARGLMRDKWQRTDLRRAAKGDLLFTSEQCEAIRRSVLARTKPQETLPADRFTTAKAANLVK